MINFSQNDPLWKNKRLGKARDTFGRSGCFVTSLSMLANVEPERTNALFVMNGIYTAGCLIGNPQKAADVLNIKYFGKAFDKEPPFYPCIAETNYYAPKVPQHFFVYLGNGQIIDPIDGRQKMNKYPIVSWRLFQQKEPLNEPVNNNDKFMVPREIDDQFRGYLVGRATDKDIAFWMQRTVGELRKQLCASQERIQLIDAICQKTIGRPATPEEHVIFRDQQWQIGEISKWALSKIN